MNNLDILANEISKENLSKIEIATIFIWYYFKFVSQDGIELKKINLYFEDCHFSKYNPTYLKNDLRKSKDIIAGKIPGTYKPNRALIATLDKKYKILFEKSEEIISLDAIIPETLYQGTRGYIELLSKQINASYESNIFDGCAVLMRRLLEILLIHSYDKIGKLNEIQDSSDGYRNLSYIINYTISNKAISISKEVQEVLDEFRQLGNFSAHKIQYNCKRRDIDNVRLKYRLAIEELLYCAGIKK